MQVTKPVGRNAPALKYDILSALGVYALSGDKHLQRRVLRILTLITTRYNWRTNELSIGREEISRLWSVDPRTVKREMAKLRVMGWIAVKRSAARGRVAVYELDLKQIMIDTTDIWPVIGPDFQERMGQGDEPQTNVVPFKVKGPGEAPSDDDIWGQVQKMLHTRDPELWSSWFQHLAEADRAGGVATLVAPSRFMADYIAQKWTGRVLAAYGRVDPSVRSVRFEASE
ncbi:DnaA N-terminal domain-containing protein [Ruegeria sp.]|uniref:DnaA N-terminal domain-containing protein n=1 Tax=Ruegeria sp. TaxID=1879320 RepID=UPI003C79CA85